MWICQCRRSLFYTRTDPGAGDARFPVGALPDGFDPAEVSAERYIEIPEPVREIYKLLPSDPCSAPPTGASPGYAGYIYYKNEAFPERQPSRIPPFPRLYNKIAGTKA
jgi:hypothetical protein